ncbi:MAG: hypothetical protein HYV24_00635 [Deltaproteobacteria bacterium]|nr:hypothetical protein [Deltaproteobacteria bacterium]
MLGVELDGVARAYPFSVLKKAEPPVRDTLAGKKIEVHFDPESEEAYATGPEGRIEGTVSYWFAWRSFHPDTQIYKGKEKGR